MLRRPIPIEKMVEEFKKNHRNSHLFKIDNFSLHKKYYIDRIESSVFDLCGRKWKIIVTFDQDEYVSIFLENQAPIHVELQYQVYVVSQLKPELHPKVNEMWDFGTSSTPKEEGIPNLMSVDDLKSKGFLIGDCCMFGASIPGLEHPQRPGTAECLSLIEKPLNNKVTWMMSQFSSFDPEKAHKSNEFVVGNRKWSIEVHPRGCQYAKGHFFSVCLVAGGFINNAPKTTSFADFKLRVFDQVKRNHVEKSGTGWFEEKEYDSCGIKDFMPLSKLGEPYLVKDKLYVGVEFEVVSVTKYC